MTQQAVANPELNLLKLIKTVNVFHIISEQFVDEFNQKLSPKPSGLTKGLSQRG